MEMAFKARENSDYFIIWSTFDYTKDEYALFWYLEPVMFRLFWLSQFGENKI